MLRSILRSEDPEWWHLLDASGVATREFAAALDRRVPTLCWQPDFTWLPVHRSRLSTESIEDPPLKLFRFKVARGYSRAAVAQLSRFAARTVATLRQIDPGGPLICTTPFYAPVAERWQGPVIYYLTDFTTAYATVDPRQVLSGDRVLARVASIVCPNSRRLADYLIERAGCDPAKIVILPNATRRSSLRQSWREPMEEIPEDLRDLRRPLIGIIGNLAGNLDWNLIERAISLTPSMSWVFVGPFSMAIACQSQSRARERVLANRRRARFVGLKPYGVLHHYARAFDAAVMPYFKHEPTWSGSSTRFYEHLAACRPMLATRGVEELTRKEPLLRLVDSGEDLAQELLELERNGFRDGLEEARRVASHMETWDCRADALVRAFKAMHSELACTGRL